MKLLAVVQARLGSTRLPRKVLAEIGDKSMIQHVLDRVARIQGINQVVVATTKQELDDELAEKLSSWGYDTFRGNQFDVLSRFWGAVEAFRADVVVRITADCPCLDPVLAELVLERFLDTGADYAANCPTRISGYPDGLDVEVISGEALGEAVDEAVYPEDREHVTRFIIRSVPFWKREILQWQGPFCVPKLSVDTQPDLERVRRVHRDLGAAVFGFKELVEYFGDHSQG